MGLSWWQMLPVGPTGYADSPYQSPSTFAGNPLLIELRLEPGRRAPVFPIDRVDFGRVIPWRMHRLREMTTQIVTERPPELDRFIDRHADVWLNDFALFTAIKRSENMRPWWEWDEDLKKRNRATLRRAKRSLANAVMHVICEQFLFDRQWGELREHCADLGIGLIGDVPIFVAHDSADVWAHPDLFILDEDNEPTVIAGVPPDYFSETGQRWGNPLYDWDRHRQTGFSWWIARMGRAFELFDLIRVDHFRGFAASWHIPAHEETAVHGEWVEAPGQELFDRLSDIFPHLPVIAENLGIITEDVEELRDRYQLPGMKVLQFGFGTESTHALDQFTENVVAYTGTHDNDTTRGWFEDQDPDREPERKAALEELDSEGERFVWDMIQAVMESVADTAIIPLQDVLDLGTTARMNLPGTTGGSNWCWRFRWEDLTDDIVERVRCIVERTGRSVER